MLLLTGPVDAISFIPHMLGFHPDDSLVVFNVDTTTLARFDHPRSPEAMLSTVLFTCAVARQFDGDRVLIVSFCDDEAYAWAAAELLREYIPARLFFPSLRVHQGIYWTEADHFHGAGHRYIATDFSALGLRNEDVGLDPKESA